MKKLLLSLILLLALGGISNAQELQCVEQGATAVIPVQFVDSAWLEIASTSKEARIYDSSGSLDTTVTDGSFTALDGTNSIGLYTVSLTVGGADPKGIWPISWKGTNGGAERTGLSSIEVRGVSECGSNNDAILTDVTGLNGDAMRGTDSGATASALATAQTDLDTITGSDGTTLATSQGNYAPSTVAALSTAQTDLDTITGADGTTLATSQGNYAPMKLTDTVDGLTVKEVLCALSAFSIGKSSGMGTTTVTFRNNDDDADVVVGTMDSGYNRTAVVLTLGGC